MQRSRGERKASVGPLPGPSPQVGDTIQLAIDGQRHALDVTALRGTPGERCGLPGTMLDVGAALRSLDAKPWACGVCTLINPPGRASCSAARMLRSAARNDASSSPLHLARSLPCGLQPGPRHNVKLPNTRLEAGMRVIW